ncbi:hypothetical protein Scep_007218 [Stephania cephalantha]|uniref:Uncharacterized protein n=1 Tax=Stephania cephalantha TaxID=152367 RepID=A0AAP0K9E8_9MAGN
MPDKGKRPASANKFAPLANLPTIKSQYRFSNRHLVFLFDSSSAVLEHFTNQNSDEIAYSKLKIQKVLSSTEWTQQLSVQQSPFIYQSMTLVKDKNPAQVNYEDYIDAWRHIFLQVILEHPVDFSPPPEEVEEFPPLPKTYKDAIRPQTPAESSSANTSDLAKTIIQQVHESFQQNFLTMQEHFDKRFQQFEDKYSASSRTQSDNCSTYSADHFEL